MNYNNLKVSDLLNLIGKIAIYKNSEGFLNSFKVNNITIDNYNTIFLEERYLSTCFQSCKLEDLVLDLKNFEIENSINKKDFGNL